jgi:hypothetical protein
LLRVLALLFGVVLLLPGVCSLGFMAMFIPDAVSRSGAAGELAPLAALWAVCFAISFGGVLMIRNAVRGSRPPGDASSRDPQT